LERSLSDLLGTSVRVKHKVGGKGTLSIRYGSAEELEGILSHIK
jgi:ParB family chromosome partitioning protein